MHRLATFYSRSRKGRWCKGETSGHYIKARAKGGAGVVLRWGSKRGGRG